MKTVTLLLLSILSFQAQAENPIFSFDYGTNEAKLISTKENPTTLKLSVNLKDSQQGLINIYNEFGKLVGLYMSNSTLFEIDFSEFPKGSYYIEVENMDNIILSKQTFEVK